MIDEKGLNLEEKSQMMKVEEAARLLGMSAQGIREGLKREKFPFGIAVKSNKHYCYRIFKNRFEEYTGIKVEDTDRNR